MPMTHEEIRGLLPEYSGGGMPSGAAEEVRAHLESCGECREEIAVLAGLREIDVPDPGGMFWETLAGKVRREAAAPGRAGGLRDGWRSWLWRPVPVAALALLLIMLIISRSGRPPDEVHDTVSGDPLEREVIDYGVLAGSDLPYIDMDAGTAEVLDDTAEGLSGYGYHREFASLTSDEIEDLCRELQKDMNKGG